MATVAKRPEALADLERIWLESAERYGVRHAEQLIGHFDRIFDVLAAFPLIGRVRHDLGDNLRFIPVRGYPFLIFFEATGRKVEIVRILHANMRHDRDLET